MNEDIPITSPYLNRELSWLSFNYRVLQEAKDTSVPLIERLRFLAIYSSNLDEFYRVRVASVRSLNDLKKKAKKKLDFSPKKLLEDINKTVFKQQEEFGQIFRNQLIPALKENNIHIVNETGLREPQREFARTYFLREIFPILRYGEITPEDTPFLENKRIYQVVEVRKTEADVPTRYLIDIPSVRLGRFLVVPDENGGHIVMFIDDVIRVSLDILFPDQIVSPCYSIKLSRDADLNIADEFSGDLLDKIRKSLEKREMGVPSRFLHDEKMPDDLLEFLCRTYELENVDVVKGGRYHNFMDYWGFPLPDDPSLVYLPQKELPVPGLDNVSFFDAIAEKDRMLHFPYQSYDYVVKLLEEAAADPKVSSIKITLYRVASDSKIAKALIKAAENGKAVEVFDEVKARFDEESNIFWGNELSKAGAKVRYSYPDLKVHTKICVIKRKEEGQTKGYAYLGTGNFNEKTSRIYGDHALLTCHQEIIKDLDRIFKFLMDFKLAPKFKHLLVAPFNMRERFEDLIDREIEHAQAGKGGSIIAKMNSLQDSKMIDKLYEAGAAGVKIQLIVRGICCLKPGVPGLSENIEARSIVDRYLEHARVYIFGNDGAEEMYVASADWMSRNLNRRVEAGFPILDPDLRQEMKDLINIQLDDNTKARIINELQDNPYVPVDGAEPIRAQTASWSYLANKVDAPTSAE